MRKAIAILTVILLLCMGLLNGYGNNAYSYSESYDSANLLKNNINKLVYLANIKSPKTFSVFIKVTKECYPDFKATITEKEFNKLLEISRKSSVSEPEIAFVKQFTNKLKSSYYGEPSPTLYKLVKTSIKSQINKMTHDFMKNQRCSYDTAYKESVDLMINSNSDISKFINEKSSPNILSTENSRSFAFLYAHSHDLASVMSNWGDLFKYAIWASHDGWVKEVVSGDDGTISYLNIYEALPDGNLDSVDRYGPPSKCKGAYNSWVKNSEHVYIQRYPNASLSQRAYNVSVNMYYGKPYNWNIANKYDPDRSYCSQNVWTGFWAYNVDLKSNRGIPYLYVVHPWVVPFELAGVLPDSIHLSPHLESVSSG